MLEPLYIDAPGGRMYTVFHPAPGASECVIFCPSLFEERRCAYRALRVLADDAASMGMAACRFDYVFTGESEGEEGDLTLESMLADAGALASWVREKGVRPVMAGLRLGALVALEAAGKAGARRAVLIAPPSSGEEFAKEVIRQRQVRAMLTSGRGGPKGAVEEELERQGHADIDGTKVSAGLWGAIRSFKPGPAEGVKVGIVQVGPRKRPTSASARLAERLGAEVKVAVSPPFWVESAKMEIEPVREVLRSVLGGRDGRDG